MRKALKTILCVALVLALAVVIALRVLPPMNAPAQAAAATPTPAAAAAVVPTPTPEPDNGLPKVNTGSWELTLVNAQNSIGEAVPEALAELESGRYFDARAVDALKDFIAGARAEGLSVCLSSAYRSYNEQTYLFNRKVSQCGGDEAAAARIVNRPGTSEHQLGLCADITDKFYEVKTKELEKTALYQWMYAHCQDYGFILRYPTPPTSRTSPASCMSRGTSATSARRRPRTSWATASASRSSSTCTNESDRGASCRKCPGFVRFAAKF